MVPGTSGWAKNIIITNKRIVVGSISYSVSNITSVSISEKSASFGPGVLIGVFGTISACSLIVALIEYNISFVVGALVFIGSWIACLVYILTSKSSFVLNMSSASGESNVFVSQNLKYIQSIAASINKAMADNK